MFQRRHHESITPSTNAVQYFGKEGGGNVSRFDETHIRTFNQLPLEAQAKVFGDLARKRILVDRLKVGDPATHNDEMNQLLAELYEEYGVIAG